MFLMFLFHQLTFGSTTGLRQCKSRSDWMVVICAHQLSSSALNPVSRPSEIGDHSSVASVCITRHSGQP